MTSSWTSCVMGPLLLVCSPFALAQGVHVAGDTCSPVKTRTSEVGCWILADDPIGQISTREVFWHLDAFPSRKAAESDKTAQSVVIESLGKVWLMTVGPKQWRSRHGTRVANIGPLPLPSTGPYSAQFMEAIFTPGMTAPPHTHPGPEAWYTTSGEACLETSDGRAQTSRAGGPPVIVPSGMVMALMATGHEERRSIVLILHPTSTVPVAINHEWTPKGLCTATAQ